MEIAQNLLTLFWKKFRESNNIFSTEKLLTHEKFSLTKKNISSNYLFSSSFSLNLEKYYKTQSPFFRQINVFTKEVTKGSISRIFLSVIAFYSTFLHCV